jgi:hypothetical protein
MPASVSTPRADGGVSPEERQRKARYFGAYSQFSSALSSHDRARINGSASPAWDDKRTISFPVIEDSPAYRSDCPDDLAADLDELVAHFGKGALAAIAVWLHDRAAMDLSGVISIEQFYVAIARIKEAKSPRLEAYLAEIAMGRNLHENLNGYAIAAHFGLKPQTIHEMLADTCHALRRPKPLSKANTKRYSKTQYRHHVERPATTRA